MRPAEPAAANTGTTLALLSGAAFLVSIDSRMVAPLLPAIAASLNTTVSLTGLIVTAYALPYGWFQIAYGPLADRFGKIAVVRSAIFVFALGTIGCGFATGLGSLMVLRVITGAFAASVIPMTIAYVGDVVPIGRRQHAISNLFAVNSSATVLSPVVGGVVASILSWRDLFIACGALTFIPAVLLWRLPPMPKPPPRGSGFRAMFGPFGTVLRNPAARTIDLLVAAEGALIAGLTYLGSFLHEVYGVDYLRVGLLMGLYGLGSVLASRIVGRAAARLGSARMVLVGATLMGLAYLALLGSHAQWLFALSMLVMGSGFVICHSTLQTRITEAVPALRGTAVALFAFSLFSGQGAGAGIMATLLDRWGYDALLLVCGVGLLLFGAVGMVVLQRLKFAAA